MKIAFIGVGRLGGALALALSEKKWEIAELVTSNREETLGIANSIEPKPLILDAEELEKITSEIIFITVPDPEILPNAERLAEKLKHPAVVFHASGALSSDVLKSLREKGCAAASLHPLVSVSNARLGAKSFKNAYFCVEGDEKAVIEANKIVECIGGNSFSIEPRFKPLYHASAVTSAGHITALFSVALEMLAACGLNEDKAQRVLLPLAESAVRNLTAQKPAQALTGTFARLDAETLRRHLEIMRTGVSADALEIYRLLGLRSLDLAAARGADAVRITEMRKMLLEIKHPIKEE